MDIVEKQSIVDVFTIPVLERIRVRFIDSYDSSEYSDISRIGKQMGNSACMVGKGLKWIGHHVATFVLLLLVLSPMMLFSTTYSDTYSFPFYFNVSENERFWVEEYPDHAEEVTYTTEDNSLVACISGTSQYDIALLKLHVGSAGKKTFTIQQTNKVGDVYGYLMNTGSAGPIDYTLFLKSNDGYYQEITDGKAIHVLSASGADIGEDLKVISLAVQIKEQSYEGALAGRYSDTLTITFGTNT